MSVEGEALRRPWRRWVSTLASCCALVIALVLMSLADTGSPVAEPVQVNQVASGPAVNHQGAGSGLVTPRPSPPPTEIPARNPAPSSASASVAGAHLVAIGSRRGGTVSIDGEQSGVSAPPATTPTTPTTVPVTKPGKKPPVTLPGSGGGTLGEGGGKKPPKKNPPPTNDPPPTKPPKHKPPRHNHHHKPGDHKK